MTQNGAGSLPFLNAVLRGKTSLCLICCSELSFLDFDLPALSLDWQAKTGLIERDFKKVLQCLIFGNKISLHLHQSQTVKK